MRRVVIAVGVVAVLAVAGVVVTRAGHRRTTASVDVSTASAQPTVPGTPTSQLTPGAANPAPAETARRAAVHAISMTSKVFSAGFISRRDLIAGIATPRFASQLADETSRQVNDLLVGLGRRTQDVSGLSVVEQPITASVTLDGSHGSASVWSVLVISVPGVGAGRQLWRTTALGLELIEGRWLIDSWTSTPGPSPAPAAEGKFDDARALAPVMAWPPAYGEVG